MSSMEKQCSYHEDGQHKFIACDEWDKTCWCGEMESATTLSTQARPELLSFGELNELIKMFDNSEPIITTIQHNLSQEKMDLFTKNAMVQKVSSDATSHFYGMPVVEKAFVPHNEMWFVDKNGTIISKFRFF